MAKVVQSRSGKKVVLLNPAERSKKYARELSSNSILDRKTGTRKTLSDSQRSYRAGYLDARKESAKIWRKKNGLPSKSSRRKFGRRK